MSPNRAFHRVLTAFALLALLVLVSLPAHARTVRQPATARHAVAASGEKTLTRLWRFVVSLLPQGVTKEGMSIDPDGLTAPAGSSSDEGMSIDPNG